jgi:UDP-N-acetylmuramyl pentapeptide phosphotransferase/UDP-N-acetylglucosamine-1-phosphate transferase
MGNAAVQLVILAGILCLTVLGGRIFTRLYQIGVLDRTLSKLASALEWACGKPSLAGVSGIFFSFCVLVIGCAIVFQESSIIVLLVGAAGVFFCCSFVDRPN